MYYCITITIVIANQSSADGTHGSKVAMAARAAASSILCCNMLLSCEKLDDVTTPWRRQ